MGGVTSRFFPGGWPKTFSIGAYCGEMSFYWRETMRKTFSASKFIWNYQVIKSRGALEPLSLLRGHPCIPVCFFFSNLIEHNISFKRAFDVCQCCCFNKHDISALSFRSRQAAMTRTTTTTTLHQLTTSGIAGRRSWRTDRNNICECASRVWTTARNWARRNGANTTLSTETPITGGRRACSVGRTGNGMSPATGARYVVFQIV